MLNIRGLRECRLRAKKTQTEVAREVGISQNYYSELERERKTSPKETLILSLASALFCSIDELYRGIGGKNDKQSAGDGEEEKRC